MIEERVALGVRLCFGTVVVSEQVLAYQRRRMADNEPIDLIGLDLPRTSFATQALWYELEDDDLGTLHAAEHSQIAVLPLLAMCDRWDIGGLSTNYHEQTGGPTIFIYDGHPGGIGITRRGYHAFERLVSNAYSLVTECPCESGCPSCVQSPEVRQPQRAAVEGRLRGADGRDVTQPTPVARGAGRSAWRPCEAHQPLTQISKCRCGPVLDPVLPTRPTRWPAVTGAPLVTAIEPCWRCMKT